MPVRISGERADGRRLGQWRSLGLGDVEDGNETQGLALSTSSPVSLLVFVGIWALMEGIGDIARAFAVRGLHRAG